MRNQPIPRINRRPYILLALSITFAGLLTFSIAPCSLAQIVPKGCTRECSTDPETGITECYVTCPPSTPRPNPKPCGGGGCKEVKIALDPDTLINIRYPQEITTAWWKLPGSEITAGEDGISLEWGDETLAQIELRIAQEE